MEYCLLCFKINKDILNYIEVNSTQWQDLDITNVLEKHFWPLNSLQHQCSLICLECWGEVNKFHKFYLRIRETHANIERIQTEEPKEIKYLSYCVNPEILQDQNPLKAVLNIEECSVKSDLDRNESNEDISINNDPLTNPTLSELKNVKHSKRKRSICGKLDRDEDILRIKEETTDSNKSYEDIAINVDKCSYVQDKHPIEYKTRKDYDEFLAEHFEEMSCDLCGVQFEHFAAMKKHFLLIHSMNKGYLVCCKRKFFQRNHLVDHLQCHFNPNHFKCPQCGKVLSDRKNFDGHMLRVHRPEDIVAQHSCEICGKSFTKAYILKAHKLKHLPYEEKKFPCTECGKLYASAYLLKIHNETAHLKKKAKVCHICGKVLPANREYKAHMNKHEGIQAPVINCDVCGLRLMSERSLKLHKETQHPVGGKKDHPCPICDKISSTASALKKHINSMHEKGFEHKCTLCEKAFRRAEALKEHMASHTGSPLYACPWCPKMFNSNGNMHAHRKNKHPIEYLEQKLKKYN